MGVSILAGDAVPGESGSLLSVSSVTKSYGGFRALSDVSIRVETGEVVGLIGENGAGKSTLLNVICGATQPDTGSMKVRSAPYAPQNYREAMDHGVFRVYQEPALVPTLKIYENMVLGLEDKFSSHGLLRQRMIKRETFRALEVIRDLVDPERITYTYESNVRQVVDILRAMFAAKVMGIPHPIIMLDEPTGALFGQEIDILFDTIKRLRGDAAFVFVSHRLQEINDVCDRSYVVKDGSIVAEVDRGTSETELHALMVGRARSVDYYVESQQRDDVADVVLSVKELSGRLFKGVSFDIHAGEILGVSGVVGSGKEQLGRVVAGAERRSGGSLAIAGRHQTTDTPVDRKAAGVGYLPADRAGEGVVSPFNVIWNLTLASLQGEVARGPFLSPARERSVAERWIDRLSIRLSSPGSLITSLSGGNQQKVVLAKWLEADMRLLVLDNPTRGIDAGAKFEIYTLLRSLAASGMGLMLVSDDLLELVGLSHRILVMKDGEIAADLPAPAHAKPDEATVIARSV
jgi:ribose transport system ATP-binding protein